jgi:hypothetical protein
MYGGKGAMRKADDRIGGAANNNTGGSQNRYQH